MSGEIERGRDDDPPEMMWPVYSMLALVFVVMGVGVWMSEATIDMEEVRHSAYGLLIAAALGVPLYTASVLRTRRFARRIDERTHGDVLVVGKVAEVTDDDLSDDTVHLESGWLQLSAVVVRADSVEVWGTNAEAPQLVLDRNRLEVKRCDLVVRLFRDRHSCTVGMWVSDGNASIVLEPSSRTGRRTQQVLSQALSDLSGDTTGSPPIASD